MYKNCQSENVSKLRGEAAEKLNPYFKWGNPNPDHVIMGDCGCRALFYAEEKSYDEVERELLKKLGEVGYRFYADVEEMYLNDTYERITIPKPKRGERAITVAKFGELHPTGNYVLKVANHWTSLCDRVCHDLWDTKDKMVYVAWRIK